MAFGHGHLWVAHGLTGQVARIDPAFYGAETIDDVAKTKFGSSDGAVAAGTEAVWAVFGDATLARIDPKSSDVERTDAGLKPTAVVEGGGSVWVVSSGDSTVYRFSPDTFLAGPLGRATVGRRSTGIAYGHDAVWVTSSGDDFVTRIDPSTYAGAQIDVGDEPGGVAVGAGAVWVANAGDGTVSRIDPATSEGRQDDRGRQQAVRDRRRRRARLGDGAGALALQADRREHEPGPQEHASFGTRAETSVASLRTPIGTTGAASRASCRSRSA